MLVFVSISKLKNLYLVPKLVLVTWFWRGWPEKVLEWTYFHLGRKTNHIYIKALCDYNYQMLLMYVSKGFFCCFSMNQLLLNCSVGYKRQLEYLHDQLLPCACLQVAKVSSICSYLNLHEHILHVNNISFILVKLLINCAIACLFHCRTVS